MRAPEVTILCATRNGGDAVRLTLESLHRFTPEPFRMLVADNGSCDGTREYLARLDWIELVQRNPRRHSPDHGATLDWLSRRVTTPWFLTLDSDVVFLRSGWLSELRSELARRGAGAVGEYEPAIATYQARLAPHVLLFDTGQFRALRCSFKPRVRMRDPEEARRWHARPPSENLGHAELCSYGSATFYSTGAFLFERMQKSGMRHSVTPARIKRMYRHLGHMSWAEGERYRPDEQEKKLRYVRAQLKRLGAVGR